MIYKSVCGIVLSMSDIYIILNYTRVVDIYDTRTRLILNSNFSSIKENALDKSAFLCYYEYVKETCINKKGNT